MMKKYFSLVMALLMSAGFAFAADLSNPDLLAQGFDDSNNTGATFDAASKTLTFDGAWTGMRWLFYGDEDALATDYQSFTIEIEPVDFWTEAIISDYRAGGPGVIQTVGIPAGESTATVDISPATQIAFQGGDGATSVKIVAAYLTPKAGGGGESTSPIIMDFSGITQEDNAPKQQGWKQVAPIMDKVAEAKYFVIETEGVGDNKDGFGGIDFIVQGGDGVNPNLGWTQIGLINSGWLSYPREDGKTISIVIDLQKALGSKYDSFIQCTSWAQLFIQYYPADASGLATAFEGLGFKQAYLTGDFAKPEGAVDLTGGTDFGFIFDGSVTNLGTTGIHQINAPVSKAYGVVGGIVVNAANENVSIYGIDGKIVKQVVGASSQTIDLAKGLYIVKVGTANAVKVVVR